MVPFKIASLDDVILSLDSTQPLMFDTETDGFYGRVELAQFYQEAWPEVIMVKRPNLQALIAVLDLGLIVLQNAAYDITTIQGLTKSRYIPKHFHDVLLLSRLHYYTESSFSLDNLMLYTLGYDPYLGQGLDKKTMQKTKWSGPLSNDQLLYAATDVYYLPQVYNAVKAHIEDSNYILDMLTLKNCLDFQNNGFPVDANRRLALEMRNTIAVADLAVPINVNSWQQVRPYVGEETSDGLALALFELQGNKRAAKVNQARKLLKMNSFLKKFDTAKGRIYGKFAPSARSGRLTCKDQNLQQIPRATKKVFGFKKDSGKVLVYADFSQLELRAACAITGEQVMAELFYKGEDLHSYTKTMMFGDRNEGNERQIAKTCNFNLLYGGSARMLGSILVKDAMILLPDNTLNMLRNKWRKLWPAVSKWQDEGIKDWNRGKYWQTPLGRRYVGKLMTDQLNIAIQGAGADVAKVACHKIIHQLKQMPHDVAMVNFIHDSYFIECPNDPVLYTQVCDIVGTSMKESWEEMSKFFTIKDIPMPVQVSVGYNWGDIESDVPNIFEKEY